MSIPSEIIADEYLHTDNGTGSLYIFNDNNHKYHLDDSKKAFERCGFIVKKENQFPIDTKENVLNTLDKIASENHKDSTSFVLLFFGTIENKNEEYVTESGDKIHGVEIWRKIMNCETLKYRPKIFIFHGFKEINTIQTDAKRTTEVTLPKYDIPIQSDILILYKVTVGIDSTSTYFRNLWENMVKYGSRDDLTNIISYTQRSSEDDYLPITVSTLRKKFFVTPSQFRLDWYDINKSTESILKTITKLQGSIHKLKLQANGSRASSIISEEAISIYGKKIRSNSKIMNMGIPDYSKVKPRINTNLKKK
nr:uncharacterized protein LOC111417438 [Onthophagus taurus]